MSVFSMDADFCISLVLLKFNLHTDMSAFVDINPETHAVSHGICSALEV